MTEQLKTLNQISMPSDGCCCEDNIRAEAIKWIKELEKQKYVISEMIEDKFKNKGVLLNTQNFEVIGAISFIKTFFNITEKELR